jgi:hypothetical protein
MFPVQGLTLDIEKGNLLRLGRDGYILAACHGTRYRQYKSKISCCVPFNSTEYVFSAINF